MIRDRIPYEVLVQGALRNVIRQVLVDVATNGLPGEHHFYITFLTNIAGVVMSPRLKERYPDHITIVLQNQFWDLAVEDDSFAVTLSFSDVPERLVVPFMAVQAFYDPVAAFETSFDIAPQLPAAQSLLPEKQNLSSQKSQDNIEPSLIETSPDLSLATLHPNVKKSDPKNSDKQEEEKLKSADVVSLDAFRKK